MSSTTFKGRNPTKAEILNYSSTVAEIKAKTRPKTWRKFVENAHDQGFTVAGMLSGAPAPLRERTNASLRQEAKSAVAAAYKPVSRELTDQEQRLHALDAKRAADHKTYEAWLSNENAKTAQAHDAADALLTNRAQQIHDAAVSAIGSMQANAVASAPTTVSDPHQSSALNVDIPNAAAKSLQSIEAGMTENAAIRAAGQHASVSSESNTQAYVAGLDAKRKAEFDDRLAKVFDTRAQAKVHRANDYLTAFTGLKAQELDKASKVQDFNALAERLGVQREELTWKKITDQIKLADADADRTERATEAADRTALAAARLAYDQGKGDLNEDGKVNAADTELKAKIEHMYGKKDDKGNVHTAGEKADARQTYQTVETARQVIADYHTGARKLPPGKTIRQVLLTNKHFGFSNPVITLAESLRKNDGTLTPDALKLARNLGIWNPHTYWGS